MKTFRRLSLLLAIGMLVASFAISLNVNVQNPTGRRYSSQNPLRTGAGTAQELGADGERVLALDLDLPNNNQSGQLQCACNQSLYAQNPPNTCNSCFGYSENLENFRIPDFVTTEFIAESKNVLELVAVRADNQETRDYQQIREIAEVALILDIPLWLYVRVDTEVDSEYYDIVNRTGGGIVYYFVYGGYTHPANQLAHKILPIAIFGIVIFGAWELLGRKSRTSQDSRPSSKPSQSKDPLYKSASAMNKAKDLQGKLRQKIDIDLTRDDD